RWRYDGMSMFCVYLALDRPVRWKAADWDPTLGRCFAVSICESLDVLDDNASDCRLGVPPRQPGLFTVHPSLFEPSLCPPGAEACFCEQIAPYELRQGGPQAWETAKQGYADVVRSEEHTSELQSRGHLVCRLLLEKKKNTRSKAE